MWRRGTGLVDTAANFLLSQEIRQPLQTAWKHIIYNPESCLLIVLAFSVLFGGMSPSFALISTISVKYLNLDLSNNGWLIVMRTVYFIVISFRGAVTLHRFWFLFDKETTYRYFIGVAINSFLVLFELVLSIFLSDILLVILTLMALISGTSIRLQWVRNIENDD